MKYFCLIIVFISYSYNCLSQEIDDQEYKIYGKYIGEGGYQFYPIDFGVSSELKKFNLKDPIFKEIKEMPMKEVNYKRLILEALPYSINKTYHLIENNKTMNILLSPIYFKNENEAYFVSIIIGFFSNKPIFSFLQSLKVGEDWYIEDYYIIL